MVMKMNKEKILAILRDNSDYVSGQKLAEELSVSRNTVWKYIKALQDEGYEIKSQTNRGYRLDKATGRLSRSELARNSGIDPERFLVFKEINSTNTYLKEHHEELEADTVVITDYQTGGRGRYGRTFYSPAGEGLYFSILFKGNVMPESEYLTMAAALAVSEVLKDYGLIPSIKWVNDIFVNDRKLCGILTEGELELESGRIKYLVLGIGINVNNIAFPEELAEIATSMKLSSGSSFDINEVGARMISSVDQYTRKLIRTPDSEEVYLANAADLIQKYNDRLLYKGETVTLSGGNREEITGTLLGTDAKGHLLLETSVGIKSAAYGEYQLNKQKFSK